MNSFEKDTKHLEEKSLLDLIRRGVLHLKELKEFKVSSITYTYAIKDFEGVNNVNVKIDIDTRGCGEG